MLTLASVALLAGCGGGKRASTGAAAGPAAAKAEITKSWEAFFDGSTPAAKRIALLQDGQAFAGLLKAIGGSPLASGVKASVTSVRTDGPDKATVTYTVLLTGQPVLKDARGTAVLVGGTWKVGTASFCKLLKLEGVVPAACGSAGK